MRACHLIWVIAVPEALSVEFVSFTMLFESVFDAYQQFAQACDGQVNPRLIPNLRTALRLCILPQYGILGSAQKRDLEQCLTHIPLEQFIRDTASLVEQPSNSEIWQKHLPGVSQGTIQNHRSVLSRFLRWIDQYSSYSVKSENFIAPYAPQMPSGRSHQKAQPYAVQEKELPDKLRQQLEQFQSFWINSHNLQPNEKSLTEMMTFKRYKRFLLCYLGWLKNIQRTDIETIDLVTLTDPHQLEKFVMWGVDCRDHSYLWATEVVRVVMLVARYESQYTSGINVSQPQVASLRNLIGELRQRHEHEKLIRQSTQSQALNFEECVEILSYLRQCCAPRNHSGDTRSELAILRSWERYLLIALLAYCPIRNQEIAQLDLSRSILKQGDEELAVVIQRTTKNETRKLQYPLPRLLSKDLDIWIAEWRPKIATDHKRVFIRLGSNRTPESLGQPLTARDVNHLFFVALRGATTALFGASLRVNPHSLRCAISNHLSEIDSPLNKRFTESVGENFSGSGNT